VKQGASNKGKGEDNQMVHLEDGNGLRCESCSPENIFGYGDGAEISSEAMFPWQVVSAFTECLDYQRNWWRRWGTAGPGRAVWDGNASAVPPARDVSQQGHSVQLQVQVNGTHRSINSDHVRPLQH